MRRAAAIEANAHPDFGLPAAKVRGALQNRHSQPSAALYQSSFRQYFPL